MNFVKTFNLVLLMSAANSFAAEFNGFPTWKEIASTSAQAAKTHVTNNPKPYIAATATTAVAAAAVTAYKNSETVKSKVDEVASQVADYSLEGLELAKAGVQYLKENTTKTHLAAATGAVVAAGAAVAYKTGHLQQAGNAGLETAKAVYNHDYSKTATDVTKTVKDTASKAYASASAATSSAISTVDGTARMALGYAKANKGTTALIAVGALAVPAAYAGYKYLTSTEDFTATYKDFLANLTQEQKTVLVRKHGNKPVFSKFAEDKEFVATLTEEQQAILLSLVDYQKSLQSK